MYLMSQISGLNVNRQWGINLIKSFLQSTLIELIVKVIKWIKFIFFTSQTVSIMYVNVFLQWSGHNHVGQSDIHPTAPLHCWYAPVAHYLCCHHRGCLRWVQTVTHTAAGYVYLLKMLPAFFLFCVCVCDFLIYLATRSSVVMGNQGRFRFVLPCCFIPSLCLMCLSGIWHCYWEYSTLSRKPGANVTISDIGFHTDFSIYLQLSQTWLIFSKFSSTFITSHLSPKVIWQGIFNMCAYLLIDHILQWSHSPWLSSSLWLCWYFWEWGCALPLHYWRRQASAYGLKLGFKI